MSLASRLRILGLTIVLSGLVVGCSGETKIAVGGTCMLNSDCNASLVCSMGKCHVACQTSADCAAGQSCITAGDQSATVCDVPVVPHCAYNSDCQPPLVCGVDQVCRYGCQADIDCPSGQTCTTTNTCAVPAAPSNSIVVTGSVYYTPGGVDSSNPIKVLLFDPSLLLGGPKHEVDLTTNSSAFSITAPAPGPYGLIFTYGPVGSLAVVGKSVAAYRYSGCNAFDPAAAVIAASTDIGTFTFDASQPVYGVAGTLNYNGSLVSAANQVIATSWFSDSGHTQHLVNTANKGNAGNNHQAFSMVDLESWCAPRTLYGMAWAHNSDDGCERGGCVGLPYFQGSFATSTLANQDINFDDTLLW